ncbi:hypothetical protein ASF43_26200 [Pseudorhodoferax sp. Leaf267]|nr:hypothetical protein ASF43_26200 [Pseudorhodoferax sp. Leaf267]
MAPRAAAAAAQLARLDAGHALGRQAQWPALAAHAAQWLAAQPDQPDALRFAAEAARARQLPEDELKAWRALRRVRPQEVQAGLDLAQAGLQHGQLAEATTLARQLVAEHGGEARAHWLLARALHAGGDGEAAESSYRRALALDPWLVGAYRGLASLAQSRQDPGTAAAIFARLSGLYPDEAWPRQQLVGALVQAQDFARAHAELQQLPPTHADSAQAWTCAACSRRARGGPTPRCRRCAPAWRATRKAAPGCMPTWAWPWRRWSATPRPSPRCTMPCSATPTPRTGACCWAMHCAWPAVPGRRWPSRSGW